MSHTLEAIAVLVMLAGFVLFNSTRTLPVGVLLVAAGGYALVLPRLVEPLESTY